MTLYEFRMLNDAMQYQATWEFGVHIDNIIYNNIHYQLYAISDFYVEIQYSATDNKIVGKLPFKTGEALEKYLNKFPSGNII